MFLLDVTQTLVDIEKASVSSGISQSFGGEVCVAELYVVLVKQSNRTVHNLAGWLALPGGLV